MTRPSSGGTPACWRCCLRPDAVVVRSREGEVEATYRRLLATVD
ncbi:hypothetical protein [Nocardioides marmoraquaticus]